MSLYIVNMPSNESQVAPSTLPACSLASTTSFSHGAHPWRMRTSLKYLENSKVAPLEGLRIWLVGIMLFLGYQSNRIGAAYGSMQACQWIEGKSEKRRRETAALATVAKHFQLSMDRNMEGMVAGNKVIAFQSIRGQKCSIEHVLLDELSQ